jgi:hypothetical protein
LGEKSIPPAGGGAGGRLAKGATTVVFRLLGEEAGRAFQELLLGEKTSR